MGIFHMFKTIDQDREKMLDLYSIQHLIGLEMHHSTKSSLNYLSIGGYNTSVVTHPSKIMWTHSYCSEHWEIFVSSLKFADTMLIESDFGLRARISIEEKGILVQ